MILKMYCCNLHYCFYIDIDITYYKTQESMIQLHEYLLIAFT